MKKIDEIVFLSISKNLNIPIKQIKKNELFDNLKNFDSLNYVKIILEISKKTKINLPIEELSEIKKIQELINLIKKYYKND